MHATVVGSDVPPPATPKKRRVGLGIGVGVGALALAAGGAFAYTQLTGEEKANTPEQAIESFYQAVANGDFIGMAKTLAPGERDVMLDSVVPLLGEMSRLELLESDLDLNKVPGYEGKVEKFTATSKPLRDDLAEVRVTGGSFSATFDPNKLPIGKFIRDLAGDAMTDSKPTKQSAPLGGSDDPLVVNKVGNRWYLSLNYNIAEAARRGSFDPYPVPAKGSGVAPRGADSPEEAVSEMIKAMGKLNVRRMIELVPPDEFAALHDYSGQFIRDATTATEDFRSVINLNFDPKLKAKSLAGDRSIVFIEDLPTKLNADFDGNSLVFNYANKAFVGSFVGEDGSKGNAEWKNNTLVGAFEANDGTKLEADYRDNCLKLVNDGEEKKGCGQQGIAKIFSDISGQEIDPSQLNPTGFGLNKQCTGKPGKPEIGFVAIKRDGKWFVSPSRTMIDSMTAVMKKLDRKDLDCIKEQIEDSINSIQGTVSDSAVDSTFESPLDPGSDPFAPDTSASDTSGGFDTTDTFPVDTIPSDLFPSDTIGSDPFPSDTFPSDTFPSDTITSDTTGIFSPSPIPGPIVEVPPGLAPSSLVTEDLIVGTGDVVAVGDEVEVHYTGVSWSTQKKFDSSWDRGVPYSVEDVGNAFVIEGWNKGLIGMRVGGRRQLIIPPDLGYGAAGSLPDIAPNETLVFVVDVISVTKS
jgi:peptidylprolyl isomerase